VLLWNTDPQEHDVHEVGVIMNGVTGRMGGNQHLVRSILAIRHQGGVELDDGTVVWPDPVLVGRDAGKLKALAEAHDLDRWTTDLDACLADPSLALYFDVQTTSAPGAVRAAIDAGKHIYCEKPLATGFDTALDLARRAQRAGVKTGVVQDKLFLPGLRKLDLLVRSGYFGRVLAVRGEFGYWVFEGDLQPPQRPSWNYRAEDGGGIILDMFPHWHYVIENLFGSIRSLTCLGATHIQERVDEQGHTYRATAEDAAYAIFMLDDGVVVEINSSWTTRPYRDDLVAFHVDGTRGSAVAGLRRCKIQPAVATHRAVWNPDEDPLVDPRDGWLEVPDAEDYDNGFKVQWERFLQHVVADEPFPWDFFSAAKGVQLSDLAHRSWRERCWVDVPRVEP
jgi:predicted dehydrogenase